MGDVVSVSLPVPTGTVRDDRDQGGTSLRLDEDLVPKSGDGHSLRKIPIQILVSGPVVGVI